MKTGAKGGVLNILSEDDMLRIHDAALALLQDPGIQSESDLLPGHLRARGRQVDRATRAIRVSPEMVDAALKTVPASFVLYGRRDPAMDLLIERDRVYYGMGGTSEPMFFDYDLWRPRQPTKADMVASTRIGHALQNIDFVQTMCMSGDKPTDQIFFHDFDAIFRNTTKPTVLNILERPFTQLLLGMAAAASGGEEALRRPTEHVGHRHPGLAAQDRDHERGHHRRRQGRDPDPLFARPDDGRDRPGDDCRDAGADHGRGAVRRGADAADQARRPGGAEAGHRRRST